MKKFKIIAFTILIIIIGILTFFIYSNVSRGNQENDSDKATAEIKFLENRLIGILNTMNNIQMRNYNISVSEISQNAVQQSTSEEPSSSGSSGGQGGGSSEGGQSGGSSGGESGSSGQGGQSAGQSETSGTTGSTGKTKEKEKYSFTPDGVLIGTEEVNWNYIKEEIEVLYQSIPTITLDLYKMNVKQDDILSFNKEFDALTLTIKYQKKEECLAQLAKTYEYMPKLANEIITEITEKTLLETKVNVVKAYSKLDSGKWDEIATDIDKAIDVYSKLLTDTTIEANKQYDIGKGYVMLNELRSTADIKDESIFLIKYKNLLEEIDNM